MNSGQNETRNEARLTMDEPPAKETAQLPDGRDERGRFSAANRLGKPFAAGADPRRNLQGRPRRGQSIAEGLRSILNEEVGGFTIRELILRRTVFEALAGKPWAIEFIAARTEGRVSQHQDLTIQAPTESPAEEFRAMLKAVRDQPEKTRNLMKLMKQHFELQGEIRALVGWDELDIQE